MDLISMLKMSPEGFDAATRGSAIRRARYSGFLRNGAIALDNSNDPRAVPVLIGALDHPEKLVREHAAWALGTLSQPDAKRPLALRLKVEAEPDVEQELHWAIEQLD